MKRFLQNSDFPIFRVFLYVLAISNINDSATGSNCFCPHKLPESLTDFFEIYIY